MRRMLSEPFKAILIHRERQEIQRNKPQVISFFHSSCCFNSRDYFIICFYWG